ncbi:MAG: tetraacyldisaccharide 4'-kinase [candidate division Zixibacteria bacterium]|nr:tetraacyldisaccharide 4'-kinase [candidate division Zixibacteria bacterium]
MMPSLPKAMLWPFSLIYGAVIFLWDLYYSHTKQVKLPCKVISVGNITVGGTGKTPLAIKIANLSVKAGYKTAIVARGYKRKAKGLIEISASSNWSDAGDEPLEMIRSTDNVRIYVCKSKTEAAIKAASDGAELIIIDDGFQHRRIYRDIDIVCLDWSNPLGPGGYIPYGLLREPPEALRRADIIIYTSYNDIQSMEKQTISNEGGIKLFWSASKITGFQNIADGKKAGIDEIAAKRAIAFCGLGSPAKFGESLNRIGLKPINFIRFRDHHCYVQEEIDILIQAARKQKAEIFVVTFKDAVKIEGLNFGDYDVYFAKLEIDIIDQSGNGQVDEFREKLKL